MTLTYAYWDPNQTAATEKLAAMFHKQHPNVTVKPQLTPWDSYWTKLQTTATSGTAPDVFWMGVPSFKFYANGKVLLPIGPLAKHDKVSTANFYTAVLGDYTWHNELYCMPRDIDSYALFYNRSLFKRAGVAYPDASWKWSDVVAAAKKLTNPAKGVYGIDAPGAASDWGFYNQILQGGGHVLTADGKKSGFDDPGTMRGVKFWTDMILKYHVSPSADALAKQDPVALFTSGKAAMYYGASWDPATIAQVPSALASTGIAPLPQGVNRHFVGPGLANCIYAKTKHQTQAWDFVKYLGTRQAAEIVGASGAAIPAYKGTADGYLKSVPKLNLKVFLDQLPNAVPYPTTLHTSAWQAIIASGLTKALTGQQSVEASCKAIAAQMNAELAQES